VGFAVVAPGALSVAGDLRAGAQQRRLRNLVVRLSGCLSALPVLDQRWLLLRAGIDTPRPDSRRAIARILHISPGREARIERVAVIDLQAAARESPCASTAAALVTVPAGDRLVAVDPVLVSHGDSSRGARALRARISTGRNQKRRVKALAHKTARKRLKLTTKVSASKSQAAPRHKRKRHR
jgi:hypothetical protein